MPGDRSGPSSCRGVIGHPDPHPVCTHRPAQNLCPPPSTQPVPVSAVKQVSGWDLAMGVRIHFVYKGLQIFPFSFCQGNLSAQRAVQPRVLSGGGRRRRPRNRWREPHWGCRRDRSQLHPHGGCRICLSLVGHATPTNPFRRDAQRTQHTSPWLWGSHHPRSSLRPGSCGNPIRITVPRLQINTVAPVAEAADRVAQSWPPAAAASRRLKGRFI